MRILVLNYEFPPIGGGASPVSKDLALELVKQGHKVTVVTMAYKALPLREDVGGIDVHRVKCLRSKPFVCHPWEQLSYLVSAWFHIRKIMRRDRFDIVHAHFIIPTGVLALWMKKKYRLPYILTAHGSDVMGYNQKRFKMLHKILLAPWKSIVRQAGAVVSPSLFLDNLIKKQLPEIKSEIIPNGVDTELFRPLIKKKHILVMCRMQETKNVQMIIQAFSMIEETAGWQLQIAGDGPNLAALKKLSSELGLDGKVDFLGWVQNKSEEHVKLFGEAAIYVSASRFENSPVSVLEALSAECRILLSDIPAHRVLVSNDSLLFPLDDTGVLARNLADRMKCFGQDSDIVVFRPFNWGQVAKSYRNIYQCFANEVRS